MASTVSAKSKDTPTPIITTPVSPPTTNVIDQGGGSGVLGTTTYYENGNIGFTQSQQNLLDEGYSFSNATLLAGKHLYLSEHSIEGLALLGNYTSGLVGVIGYYTKLFGGVYFAAFLLTYKYQLQAASYRGGHNGATIFMPYVGGTSSWHIFAGNQLYSYN